MSGAPGVLRVRVAGLVVCGPVAAVLVAGAGVGTGSTPSAAASPAIASGSVEPVTSADGVEVSTYGVVRVTPDMNSTLSPHVEAVHAVQRVGDRTVVYWSAGYEDELWGSGFSALGRRPTDVRSLQPLNAAQFVNVAAPEAGVLLYAVPDPADPRAASGSDSDALPQEPGTMVALYTVLAGLPADVTEVDVTLGYAGIVADVPVGEGLLEPTAEGPVVPPGTGWPEVDDRFLQPVQNLVPSVRPLVTLTEQIDGASRESETTEQVTIDISADVLFAFDSADLTPEARQRVADVAADVAGRAAPGQVSVIGHTDSTASDAYNDDLSRRRAQAVADVMAPILQPAGISLTVDGRGEREPVTDNSTEEARQLNRRVTVTFAQESP